MSDELIRSVVTIATAIVGLAILAVLVSKSANTSNVLTSAGSAFSGILKAAVSPVSSGSFNSMGGAALPTMF